MRAEDVKAGVWRCLSCEAPEGFAGGALCARCAEADFEAWQEFDRASNDHDAAIEALRVMLLEHAAGQASAVRETRVDPWSSSEDTTDLEHGACIAIALALLL